MWFFVMAGESYRQCEPRFCGQPVTGFDPPQETPMSHAMSQAFHDVDPKRVTATAGAIAVHVLALMLLLAPMQVAPPKYVPDEPKTMEVVPDIVIPPTPPPPPVQEVVRRPPDRVVPQPMPVIEAPPVIFTDASPMAQAVEAVETQPIETFEISPPAAPVTLAMLTFPAPPYPAREQRMGIAGRVVLRVEVDAEGRPTGVTVERSSGNSALDKAALQTVLRKWRFVPAQRNGENVPAVGLVPIDFVLD
jgi:protein TonB